MSCTTYIHNGPVGTTKYISGTTCAGSATASTLSLGQSICMDDTKPIVNLNNLAISGSCLPVTPTPTSSAPGLCYYSGLTYSSAPFICPNDGNTYEDIYGKLTYTVQGGAGPGDHPDYSIVVSNGIDFETILLPRGQAFIEYVYLKKNFTYSETICEETIYADWDFYSYPGIPDCFATPTPTPTLTATQTPTISITPSVTPASILSQARIWVDFNDLSTIEVDGSNKILNIDNKGAWTQLTGFTQSGSTLRPTLQVSNCFGSPLSATNISNKHLYSNINMTGYNWTTFVVMCTGSVFQYIPVSVDNQGNRNQNKQILWNPSDINVNINQAKLQIIQSGGTGINEARYVYPNTNWGTFLFESNFDCSTNNPTGYININNNGLYGVLDPLYPYQFSGLPENANSLLYIINQYSQQTENLAGEIGEIIMFDFTLNSSQQATMRTYLANKWGLSLAPDVFSTPTPTPSVTVGLTPTSTQTPTKTPTDTPTSTPTTTKTPTYSPSSTPTQTPTVSITASLTQTPTLTKTPTPSITATKTPTPTVPVKIYNARKLDSSCNSLTTFKLQTTATLQLNKFYCINNKRTLINSTTSDPTGSIGYSVDSGAFSSCASLPCSGW